MRISDWSSDVCSSDLRERTISPIAVMAMGSNPVDGKRLILEKSEADVIFIQHPDVQHFFRPYGGTKELLTNALRTCLWVDDGEVDQAIGIAPLGRIIEACRIYREGAGRDAQKAARKPHAFCYRTFQDEPFVYVGNTIGSEIAFVPAKLSEGGTVISHAALDRKSNV